MIRLIKDGHTAKEITNELDIKRVQEVYTYARESGLKVAKANTRKLETIRKMVDEGKHYDEIAEAFNTDRKTITRYCHANGIYATPKPIEKGNYKESDAINALAKYNTDWKYIGGYTGSEGFMIIKHSCGYIVRKSCISIRHNPARCEVCEAIERKNREVKRKQQIARQREAAEFFKPVKQHKQTTMKECPICGCFFYGRGKYCGEKCAKKSTYHYMNMKKEERRLQAWTKESKTISLFKLYKRDGGKCWLCGKQCDYDAESNSNNYPSIDHVIPIAEGGKDEWSNIRLAHRLCNTLKGARIVEKDAVDIAPFSQQCG